MQLEKGCIRNWVGRKRFSFQPSRTCILTMEQSGSETFTINIIQEHSSGCMYIHRLLRCNKKSSLRSSHWNTVLPDFACRCTQVLKIAITDEASWDLLASCQVGLKCVVVKHECFVRFNTATRMRYILSPSLLTQSLPSRTAAFLAWRVLYLFDIKYDRSQCYNPIYEASEAVSKMHRLDAFSIHSPKEDDAKMHRLWSSLRVGSNRSKRLCHSRREKTHVHRIPSAFIFQQVVAKVQTLWAPWQYTLALLEWLFRIVILAAVAASAGRRLSGSSRIIGIL